MRILLAEDEGLIATLITRALNIQGDGVEIVASCHEAIQKLREKSYDLVMLDMHLLDGDGWPVVDAIEAAPGKHPPVLLITGDRFEADNPNSHRVSAVLPKPFNISELEHAVGQFRR